MTTGLDALTREFGPLFGERWIVSDSRRAQYMIAEGHHAAVLPDLVVRPETVEEVQRLVAAAAAARVPIVPLGVGT